MTRWLVNIYGAKWTFGTQWRIQGVAGVIPPPWNVDDVTRTMSKGGGACECPRVGYFSIFRRAADDVTRIMSKEGTCECPRVTIVFITDLVVVGVVVMSAGCL